MPNDLRLAVRIEVKGGKDLAGELRVSEKELRRLSHAIDKTGDESAQTASQMARMTGEARRGARFFDAQTRTWLKGGSALSLLVTGLRGIVRVSHQVPALADSYTELTNSVRLVIDSERELAGVRDDLLAISLRTRLELQGNAALYNRVSLAVEDLGRTEAERLRVVELLNKQVRIGGSDTREASAGLIQFAQGLASGRLQGDELRSVMEKPARREPRAHRGRFIPA